MKDVELMAKKHDDLLYAFYFSNETIQRQREIQKNFLCRLSQDDQTRILNWQLQIMSEY